MAAWAAKPRVPCTLSWPDLSSNTVNQITEAFQVKNKLMEKKKRKKKKNQRLFVTLPLSNHMDRAVCRWMAHAGMGKWKW